MSKIVSQGHYVVGYSLEEPRPIHFLSDEALEHLNKCQECLAKTDKANRLIGQIEAHDHYVKIIERWSKKLK